nr:MAG TPA: hypothetical protein [Caudoviricetes sp.]
MIQTQSIRLQKKLRQVNSDHIVQYLIFKKH